MDETATMFAFAAFGGYVLGSIPFGLVFTRLAGIGDIRDIGSGNIGATNVLRTGNKPLALATLVFDSGKGGAAVFLVATYMSSHDLGLVAGAAAVVGHNFPIWLKFKGGKGVASALGTLLVAAWPVGVAACLTWLATAALFRFSSLAGIVALCVSPVFAWHLISEPEKLSSIYLACGIAALVTLRHHTNIRRLIQGTEPRIGKKKDQ